MELADRIPFHFLGSDSLLNDSQESMFVEVKNRKNGRKFAESE